MDATFAVAVTYNSVSAAEDAATTIGGDTYSDDMNKQLEQSNSLTGVSQTAVTTPVVEDAASTTASDEKDSSSGSKALTIGIVLITTAVFVFLLIVCLYRYIYSYTNKPYDFQKMNDMKDDSPYGFRTMSTLRSNEAGVNNSVQMDQRL